MYAERRSRERPYIPTLYRTTARYLRYILFVFCKS